MIEPQLAQLRGDIRIPCMPMLRAGPRTGDLQEVAKVERGDRVAQLQRGRADQQSSNETWLPAGVRPTLRWPASPDARARRPTATR